jgi:hypothetical protein
MTYAIMLGHMAEPPEMLDEGWYSLTSKYDPSAREPRPDTPCGDGDHRVIGYWIAVGASGERGALDMPNAIQLDRLESEEPYAEAIRVARGGSVRRERAETGAPPRPDVRASGPRPSAVGGHDDA